MFSSGPYVKRERPQDMENQMNAATQNVTEATARSSSPWPTQRQDASRQPLDPELVRAAPPEAGPDRLSHWSDNQWETRIWQQMCVYAQTH